MPELPDDIYAQIQELSAEGNALADAGKHQAALQSFANAIRLVPQPWEEWEASTWLLAGIADCHFFLGNYEAVRGALNDAMHCPGALGNPFIHLRLGQANFELGDLDRAADELTRAYMGAGDDAFASEDKKYLAFLKTRAKIS